MSAGVMRGIGLQKVGAYTNLGAYYGVGLATAIILIFVFQFDGRVCVPVPVPVPVLNLLNSCRWHLANLFSWSNSVCKIMHAKLENPCTIQCGYNSDT